MRRNRWALTLLGVFMLAAPATAEVWTGLYTPAASYAPGDKIPVHVSTKQATPMFVRLVRLDADWTKVARSKALLVRPQQSYLGSFLEYPGVTLSGRTSFTLEGWLYPTIVGGDLTVVAGQIGTQQAAAGIVITPGGRFAGYVSNVATRDPSRLVVSPLPTEQSLPQVWAAVLHHWHHLALTYGGSLVKLYVDGVLVASREQTRSVAVAEVDAPFRMGARSEAPGDGLTGLLDGGLDSWALWPRALSAAEVEARRQRGLHESDPAPNPADVDLFLGFEGPYPSVADSSHHHHACTIHNHGVPGMAGVFGKGRAFRLHHDQIVDAGWNVTTNLRISADAPSGLYAVQAYPVGTTPPMQGTGFLFARTIAVRPAPDAERARIAVVVPTNTWTVYNSWPGGPYYQPDVPQRRLFPGGPWLRPGGENTAYAKLGDDISRSRFYGRCRPAREASPIMPAKSRAEYTVRAANSMYLTQWLDAHDFEYDVYTEEDLDAGTISAADYKVLVPHSHNEYWTLGALKNLARLLQDGGSVVAPAGNAMGHLVAYGPGGIVESHRNAHTLGLADLFSAIHPRQFLGNMRQSMICNGVNESYYGSAYHRALGVVNHYISPCGSGGDRFAGGPFCLGQWLASNTDHWLWEGRGLESNDLFGVGRRAETDAGVVETNALGHEADTWVPGLPLPGLGRGQWPVILAEGTNLTDYDKRVTSLLQNVGKPDPTCEEIIASKLGLVPPGATGDQAETSPAPPTSDGQGHAGTIVYFPHDQGGHVLAIAASATPWALKSDAKLSGLLDKALRRFVYGEGSLVAHADLVPLRAKREGYEKEGTFRIRASATDPNHRLVSLLAVLRLPSLDGLTVELKTRRKTRIEIDLAKSKATIAGPDPAGLLGEIQAYGGVLVENGQRAKIEIEPGSEYKLELKKNRLRIHAPELTLWVAANGTHGEADIDLATPVFPSARDDHADDDDHDDDDHGD